MKTRALTFTILITLWRLARSVTQSTPGASDSPTFQALQPCSSHICQSYLNKCNKKSQNVRKGRNRKKEFRGAKDFILVLGAWGRILTRGYPSSPSRRAGTIWFHKFRWAKSFQSLISTWEQIYLLQGASLVNWSFKLESLSCHL